MITEDDISALYDLAQEAIDDNCEREATMIRAATMIIEEEDHHLAMVILLRAKSWWVPTSCVYINQVIEVIRDATKR